MLIPGGPFENFSIPEIQTTVRPSAHGGLSALEIPEAFKQHKRQPVHRNLIPPLSGIGYFRGATSAVGHLSRSIATFHFAGPPPFSVIPISLHALSHLSIWISITPGVLSKIIEIHIDRWQSACKDMGITEKGGGPAKWKVAIDRERWTTAKVAPLKEPIPDRK